MNQVHKGKETPKNPQLSLYVLLLELPGEDASDRDFHSFTGCHNIGM